MRKSFISLVFLAFCSVLVAQQALSNDSIIKLTKAGLSEDLIVSTINSQAGTFDTSTDGLIALKGAGVSDKVVAAIVARAAAAAQPAQPRFRRSSRCLLARTKAPRQALPKASTKLGSITKTRPAPGPN